MNYHILPTALADIIDRTQSIAEAQRLLGGMAVQPIGADVFHIGGLLVQVGRISTLGQLHGTLRMLEPLNLGIAPVVVAYRELGDGGAILVTRYLSAPGERIVAIDSADGPFRNAAKAEFLRYFERLLEAGYSHSMALRGFEGWMFAEDSGAIVLDSWWALQKLRDPEDTQEERERISELLDRLPWRRRVSDKAEALRGLLGHSGPSEEVQALSWLAQAGYPLEAELWGAHLRGKAATMVTDGRWHGRTAHLGRDAPPDAKLGDLWFDPRELGVLLRIGSGWLALRALEPWQCIRAPHVVPPHYVAGPAGDPIVDLTWHEAVAIAQGFGKTLPAREDWQMVKKDLTSEMFQSLWNGNWLEWTLTPSPSAPDEVAFVQRLNLRLDFESEAARDAGRASLFERAVTARRGERHPKITMRTFLKVQG